MPLGTLDRTPPPFFKQGPSAFSKLLVFSSLAAFLMVADVRLRITQPLRAVVATVLYPVQWLALQPVQALRAGASHFASLQQAQSAEEMSRVRAEQVAARAGQVEQLLIENQRLRSLLALRERVQTTGLAAEVLYDAADTYTRKLIIDKGMAQGIQAGSPVIDEAGVIGQVTRVHPLVSEVTLVIDRDHAIPVINTRTGARSVAYGDTSIAGGALELRFMAGNADVQPGDLLSTSGVDGVYPPGLPVARVEKVDRRVDSGFARIICLPQGQVHSARHVMVLKPVGSQLPARPPADEPVATGGRKAGRK